MLTEQLNQSPFTSQLANQLTFLPIDRITNCLNEQRTYWFINWLNVLINLSTYNDFWNNSMAELVIADTDWLV